MKRQEVAPEVAAIFERELSAEEVSAFMARGISEDEITSTLELVTWFLRRYPTARERFAYNRRAYARSAARTGIAIERPHDRRARP